MNTAVSAKSPFSVVRTSPEMQAIFNTAVRDNLPIMILTVALFHAVLGVSTLYLLPPESSQPLIRLAITISILLFVSYIALRYWTLPPRWAHPVAAGVAALATINAFGFLFVTFDPRQTMLLIFIVVGVGFFFLSPSWLGLAFSVIVLG